MLKARAKLRTLLLVSCLTVPAVGAADRILYDEDAATQWSELERAAEVAEAAYEGQMGIRVEPTKWHQPFLRIPERTDFRPYDLLEFYVRSTSGLLEQSVAASDYDLGARVSLASYTEGGVLDEQWRKVSIPVGDLASEAFPLDSVFLLIFDKMSEPQSFYLDNMVLRQTSGPLITGYSLRSSRALTVTADAFDPVASASAAEYTVTSLTDPDYLVGKEPLVAGTDRQAIGVSEGGKQVERESRLHLLLPHPLKTGHEYLLALGGLKSENGIGPDQTEILVGFDPQAVSSSIKVNQVGYAPGAPKIAYVGNWLGDAGAMPVDAQEFTLQDAESGAVVYSGDLVLRAENDPQSGEDLFEADFSEFLRRREATGSRSTASAGPIPS